MASLNGRVGRLADRMERIDRAGGAACTRCGGLHAVAWMRRQGQDPAAPACTCACCPFLAALGEFGRGTVDGGLR